ncbi:MAG: PfaD family polyunsaturated fatty acid/polyketide biosynthesis protein [Pseudomonadota bacterium]|nr:PfaD family polyunsaturated fatty acid/polyketide biosynthesis protein [Pseudomonadota bacterium]
MPEPLSRAVFLVSGGARGITAECVTALARAHGGAFILVGRTPVDPHPMLDDGAPEDVVRRQIASMLGERGESATPIAVERVLRGVRARAEIARTLDRIERAGGRARYLAVDVTDGEALRQAVASAGMGPVSGIIHGAGMLADKRIEAKSDQDIAAVHATKVHGLRAMLSAVDEANLSHLALFSSTSGFHGNVGQSDYAAANEVLNKFAHAFKRRFPACRTVAFNWGPWDGGMVTPFLRSLFESHGVRVMSAETGARVFVDVLGSERSSVQVLVNDVGPPHGRPDAAGAPVVRRTQPALRVSRVLSVEKNPFLRDHVIGGNPVLPAAFAGLWMANVCQQANPGYRFVDLADFRVLKGLVFDGTAADRYRLEIKDVEASGDGIAQSVVITSTTRDQKPRYHYRGTVRLARALPSAPEPCHFDLGRDPRLEALEPYADGALFHGPTFQAITRVVRIGPKRITVECRHPRPATEVLGQFPPVAFDAVSLDVQFQCLGLWAHHTMGAAALPTSWAHHEVFAHPPTDGEYYVTADIEGKSEFAVRASICVHDAEGRIFARVLGIELTVHRPAAAVATAPEAKATNPEVSVDRLDAAPPPVAPQATGPRSRIDFDRRAITQALRDVEAPSFVVKSGARIGVTRDRGQGEAARGRGELLADLPPTPPSRFGAASFRREYGVRCAYMAGAMAKGIASEELVIALGRAGFLGTFGAGGLSIERIEQAVVHVKEALPTEPYAFNLLHSPRKLATEDATVDVYLKHGVRTVEASSYVDLTPSIVRYRVAGLSRRADGTIVTQNRVIAKLSRLELASRFMLPPPGKLVQALLEAGQISREQAQLASHVPMADDVTVEADSGGHTDNRPLVGLLPATLAVRDDIQREERYPVAVRVGAAGGIATPQAVLAAFTIGADYVVTGSINQSCIEAGTSDYVKRLLSCVEMTDVAMAPDSDLFEHGGRVQVVKQRSLFPMRAQKLYACYQAYESLDAIPAEVRRQLEKQIFRDSLDTTWEKTASHLAAYKPEQLARAADPKVKMALLFKWYMGQSSRWAVEAAPERELDYQVWCGPAMGAFNAWARGTYLESPENRRAADIARVLMWEAAYLHRVQHLRLVGLAADLSSDEAA